MQHSTAAGELTPPASSLAFLQLSHEWGARAVAEVC